MDIANTEGKYKNFTGTIDYKKNTGYVENATFELNYGMIFWEDGKWKKVHGKVVLGIMVHGKMAFGKTALGKMENGNMVHGLMALGKR